MIKIYLLLILCFIIPVSVDAAGDQDTLVAEMGETRLTRSMLNDVILSLSDVDQRMLTSRAELMTKLARDEVVKLHLLQQARQSGLQQRSEVAWAIQRAGEQALLSRFMAEQSRPDDGYPSEDLVRQVYDKNREQFKV